MKATLTLIGAALAEHGAINDDPPTTVAVAPDVYTVLIRCADRLDPRAELTYAGVTRVHGLDVEIDDRLPAGMIEVQ